MGLTKNLGSLSTVLTESDGNVLLNPNNTVGGTNVYIGQTMATNDSWRIYGNSIAIDRGEMVFELGDNASASSSNGQRFNFYYNNTSSGTAKSPFILDYNDAIFDTNASFTGNISLSNGSYYKVGSINLVNDTQYIPKATTLGYFVNSLLYDNGTNVGIGTDLPNEKLEVNGYILSNDGSYGGKVSLGSSSGPYISGNALMGELAFGSSSGSPSMIIDIAGRVGIGTVDPIGKLNIFTGFSGLTSNASSQTSGSISFGNNSSGSAVPSIIGKSNDNTGISVIAATNNTNAGTDFSLNVRENDNTDFSTLTSSAFRFSRYATPLVDILRNGNVGIGTTSPYVASGLRTLAINDTTGSIFDLMTNGTTVLRQYCVTNAAVIEGVGATSIRTITNGVERMRIFSSGNVFIGSSPTDAGYKLDVNGTGRFADTIRGQNNAIFLNSSTNILNIGSDQYMYGGTNSDGGIFVYGNNKLHLSTNSVRRLTVDGSGNVGIGTSGSPVSKLQINSGWGNVPITSNRMLQMDLGDVSDYQQHVILLHPIYDTTLINYNFCIGSIYSARGTSSAGRISDNYNVDTASAYNSTSGTVNSTGQFGKLYTCMYNGVKYIALMPFYRTSATGYTFDGYSSSTGEQLKIVVYRTSNTGVVNNSEVYNSLVEYASGPSLYQGDIQTAKSLYASGNIAIGTGTSTTKLTIDNSASSNTNHIDMVGYSSTAKGHIGTFTNALYLSSNYYYAGGQNADTTSLGQAAIILQAAATTGSYIDFNTGSAGATFPTNRMRITSDGNVGIGVVPETWSSPVKALQIGTRASLYDTAGSTILGYNTYFNTTNKYIYSTSYAMRYLMNDSGHAWETAPGGTADANITYTERMRITPGGNVDINIPTVNASEPLRVKGAGAVSKYGIFVQLNSSAAIGYPMRFWNEASNSAVGSITMNSASTSYNTSSDYRLKEDIKPIENALERLQNLKPVNFAWKVDGSRVDGFIAHELADVIPSAVSGEKDATEEVEVTPAVLDEEGNLVEEAVFETRDVYQGIDQSKIVPLLVAAIQEQQEIIKQLENRIINLENK